MEETDATEIYPKISKVKHLFPTIKSFSVYDFIFGELRWRKLGEISSSTPPKQKAVADFLVVAMKFSSILDRS
jgi:hypothetical protein